MRPGHFDALAPICPRCRVGRLESGVAQVASADHLVEAVLTCAHPECRVEFPVVDGIPVLVPAPDAFLRDALPQLLQRDDLSPVLESLLGDAAGPGSPFDATRLHVGSYAWDHWGDLDPAPPPGPPPGSVLRVLEHGLGLLGGLPPGPVLDLGCAVGRTSFALAAHTTGPVLGLDLGIAMLRLAQRALRTGEVRYPLRRIGLVYDRRSLPVAPPGADRVDFWAADAQRLPFADGRFAAVVALNLIDCVADPGTLLGEIGRVLAPGGAALVATPYDWSAQATRPEGWIGGHSQRGPGGGAAEPLLRSLLTPGGHPASIPGLSIVGEAADLPWHVRLHDRSAMTYRLHLLALRKA